MTNTPANRMTIIIENFYKSRCKTAAADNCYGMLCGQLVWFNSGCRIYYLMKYQEESEDIMN